MPNSVFQELQSLVTEARNPVSEQIDCKSTEDVLHIINSEDQGVAHEVAKEIPHIAKAVDAIVEVFRAGGRLFYIGAGTSGRLGVLDAAECPPTYGTAPEMVQGIIAGGESALVQSIDGCEDQEEDAVRDLEARGFTRRDVLCGIAASVRTPYVVSALREACAMGAKTIYVTCNPRSQVKIPVDVSICPVVGPEVVAGSTRMKAGTATKMILNMLTTASMVRMGKVYDNMMVDLKMTSRKLEERSKRTLMMVAGLGYEEAANALQKSEGHVKAAIVMILADVDLLEAKKRLERTGGFVRGAIVKQRI